MTASPSTPASDAASASPTIAPRPPVSLTRRERALFDAICRFGQSDDSSELSHLRLLYTAAQRSTAIARRLRLLDAVADLVRDLTIGPVAYHSFMFHESQPRVIARAASLAAEAWPSAPDDPMHGARELAGWARSYARRGQEWRAVGLFAGVALCGAMQAFECAGPCWRALTPNGRRRLARLLRREAHAGIADWLQEWMGECAGREFAEVAKTLAAIPRNTHVHPLVPTTGSSRAEAYDHRIAYERFTAWKNAVDLEHESPPTVAMAIADEILLSQLNAVSLHLAAHGRDVAALHPVLRRPWVLGYVLGVANATLGRCGVAQEPDEHSDALTAVHRTVLGRIASPDLSYLSHDASRSPEFERGAHAGAEDTAVFWDDEGGVMGLASWLVQRLGATGHGT